VSLAVPGVTKVSAAGAPTKKKRKASDAASERASVAPLPSIVMSLRIGGRAFSPYHPLCDEMKS
jgi:hypothetical protein